jgi:hypothetical protein
LSFENGDELVRPHVTRVFSPFVFREVAFRRFSGEFFDASLQVRVGLKTDYCVSFSRQDNFQQRPDAAIKQTNNYEMSFGTALLPLTTQPH